MSGFTDDWLALREPADKAARSRHLTGALAAACANKAPQRIVDLGAGSGANLRFLAPYLRAPQHWLLVDHDRDLLEHATEGTTFGHRVTAETCALDLASDLFRIDLAADIVTASALMDLVSADWFNRLAELCRAANVLLLFVLTFDGRIEFAPAESFDARLIELFNRHQATDKGFGPALGPTAPAHMAARLGDLGFRVETAPSDWHLGNAEATLQETLLTGYAEAAKEIASEHTSEVDDWLEHRRALLADGQSRLTVGHVDLFAAP